MAWHKKECKVSSLSFKSLLKVEIFCTYILNWIDHFFYATDFFKCFVFYAAHKKNLDTDHILFLLDGVTLENKLQGQEQEQVTRSRCITGHISLICS